MKQYIDKEQFTQLEKKKKKMSLTRNLLHAQYPYFNYLIKLWLENMIFWSKILKEKKEVKINSSIPLVVVVFLFFIFYF